MKSKRIVLSLDAMGGDNAPTSVIDAACSYHKRNRDVTFIFTGKEEVLAPLLKERDLPHSHYQIINTSTVVQNDEQPVRALKTGRDSSMYKAIELVKNKIADASLSGGNTGALMVMSKVILGDIHNLKRPAITSVFPNAYGGGSVLLDVGANVECDAGILEQFALMGICFAKTVLNINNPRVGIMNIGHEEGKGRELEKATYERLRDLNINFIGNIEPMDIVENKVDVIVTDGFTGNITIKVAEAASSICTRAIKEAINYNIISKILGFFLKKYLKDSFAKIDHRKYNGAMFVGVNGITVKSHGSSDAVGFENAIHVAYNLAKRDVNRHLAQMLKKYDIVPKERDGIIEKIVKSSTKLFHK